MRPALALGEQRVLAGDIEGFAFAVGAIERDMDDARRRAAEQVRDRAERLCAGKGVAGGDEIADRYVPDLLVGCPLITRDRYQQKQPSNWPFNLRMGT